MSLILFLPLASSIYVGLYGFRLGSKGSALIVLTSLIIPWLVSCWHFYCFLETTTPSYLHISNWIQTGLVVVRWTIFLDALTSAMFVLITTISTLMYIYSLAYMSDDPHIIRFSSYIALFTFLMLVLITAENMLQLFVGWEGVGICSYLLINFWYTRLQANKAAMQAVFVNKIGDMGVLLALIGMFAVIKSFDFASLFTLIPYLDSTFIWGNTEISALSTIAFLLFIGAVGKSAQLGLHIWLPSAMEGPTPVSALIHAATMVTAGIFLIIRCTPLFENTDTILLMITTIGTLTTFVAATVGLVQNDLKRVVAYSTCSQLGYMFLACGLSNHTGAFFHLLNHGCFKALLFLSAGAIIHSLSDDQDLRRMGGLAKTLPTTYCTFLIGSLTLIGFPFLTGYYSKELILEIAFCGYTSSSKFAYILGTASAFCTAIYSTRLLYLAFWTTPNLSSSTTVNVHEAPKLMILSTFILSMCSLFIGFLSKDIFVGLGSPFWGNSLFIASKHYTHLQAEFLPATIKLTPLILSGLGVFVAILMHKYVNAQLSHFLVLKKHPLYLFLNHKWYIDCIYNAYILQPIFHASFKTSFQLLDKGWLEIIGPKGNVQLALRSAQLMSYCQTGLPYHYTLIMFIGLYSFIHLAILFNTSFQIFHMNTLLYYLILIPALLIKNK